MYQIFYSNYQILIFKIFVLGTYSPQTKHLKNPKLDKCDQYLKCLANPELVYNINAEDPFLKM